MRPDVRVEKRHAVLRCAVAHVTDGMPGPQRGTAWRLQRKRRQVYLFRSIPSSAESTFTTASNARLSCTAPAISGHRLMRRVRSVATLGLFAVIIWRNTRMLDMKTLIPWIIAASLTGCGTIKTLTDEDGAADDLARWESNCSVVPRIYSGAAYQFCNLDSAPRVKNVPAWEMQPPESYLLDLGLSAVADTLVLPYTAYQQVVRGSIEVRRSKK